MQHGVRCCLNSRAGGRIGWSGSVSRNRCSRSCGVTCLAGRASFLDWSQLWGRNNTSRRVEANDEVTGLQAQSWIGWSRLRLHRRWRLIFRIGFDECLIETFAHGEFPVLFVGEAFNAVHFQLVWSQTDASLQWRSPSRGTLCNYCAGWLPKVKPMPVAGALAPVAGGLVVVGVPQRLVITPLLALLISLKCR
jgi:hypothetical protein